jgi:OOP family OmpA-OmpF porin
MNIFLLFKPKQMHVCKINNTIKTTGRLLILLVACTSWVQSQSQQTKSPVQLADQYFAAGEYYTAANLYEQFLNPPKKQKAATGFPLNVKGKRAIVTNKNISRTDILFKQAESYRLANYWQEAAKSYKECAEKNPGQYADALYWYAVCERSLSNYEIARESLKQYLSSAGISNQYKEEAEKELQTLLYIQQQLARPDSVLIKMHKLNAPNVNEKGAFAPVQISGNQFLISSTQTDSVKINGVNPYHSRLFYATLSDGSLEEMIPVTISATEPMNNQGAAAISADGNYLYFSQWKKENGATVLSIYYATKQTAGWGLPTLLPSVNIDGYNSKQPFCSADGKYLFFASDRPGGSGKFDIWYAPLKSDGTAGEPVNAGTTINTSGDEQAPFYHNSSETLVFSSNGRTGMGGYDLFAAKGSEATWKLPENMGHPVNSSRDDIYFFAPEKTALLSNAIFSSDRGAGCCLETYRISKAPKNKRLTGILRDCKDNTPVANAEVILKDVSGKTWKATTDADGKYLFDLKSDPYQDLKLAVTKELYQETTSPFKVERIDESDLLTDKLINTDVCIEKKPEPEPEPKLVIKAEDVVTVYFDFDRSILKPAALSKLDSIYNVMVEYPVATIQISGYTDGLGSEEYNKVLSDKRARACADYLIKKGIETDRVSFVSFGACCPVEMELINGRDNPDGRSLNRRALINVKKE